MDNYLGVDSLYPEKWEETKVIALGKGNPATLGQAAEREKELCLHIQDRWGRRSEMRPKGWSRHHKNADSIYRNWEQTDGLRHTHPESRCELVEQVDLDVFPEPWIHFSTALTCH